MISFKEYNDSINEAVNIDKSYYLKNNLDKTIIQLRKNYIKSIIDNLKNLLNQGSITNNLDIENPWRNEIKKAFDTNALDAIADYNFSIRNIGVVLPGTSKPIDENSISNAIYQLKRYDLWK